MASPNEEIFWALTTVHEVMNAVIIANKRAGIPNVQQLERDWITLYTIVLNSVDKDTKLELEAQEAVDFTLAQIGIAKSP